MNEKKLDIYVNFFRKSGREKVATSSNFFAKVKQDNCRAETLAAVDCRLVGKWLAIKLPYVATF